MWNWDYHLDNDWKPTTDGQWEWFLVRKIHYGQLKGLQKDILKKYFPQIKRFLDPGKAAMLENFFKHETD